MRNHEWKVELKKKVHQKKKRFVTYFKLNLYMFCYQTSRIFSRFLIISWYDFIVFNFITISAVKFAHTVHIQSKNKKPSGLLFWEVKL